MMGETDLTKESINVIGKVTDLVTSGGTSGRCGTFSLY